MKCLFLLLIALACLTIFSSPALACQCLEFGTPVCAAYWRSDAVFVGQLRDITPPDPKSTGKVIWKDRGPATDAHISVFVGGEYLRRVETDKTGRFSFNVYGDFKYEIEAQMWGEVSGKSDRIAITDKSTNLMLVLKAQ